MEVTLFLGSGVSLASGLPSVQEVTTKILYGEWCSDSNDTYWNKPHASETLGQVDVVHIVQLLLRYLAAQADGYLQPRTGRKAHYEDIYYMVDQLALEESGEIDNPVVWPFVEAINCWLREQVATSTEPWAFDLRKGEAIGQPLCRHVYDEAHLLMSTGVPRLLVSPGVIKGLGALLDLERCGEVEAVTVITTNHDELIERHCEAKNVVFNDGFRRNGAAFAQYAGPPERSDIKMTLVKLHGSVDLYWSRKRQVFVKPDRRKVTTESPEWLDMSGPIILCGTYNKTASYAYGIHYDMRHAFLEHLKKCSVIVMSGYGWNDREISGHLFTWLADKEHKIVLLHETPEDIRDNSKSAMWHRFDGLVKGGQLILIRKWLSDVSGADILDQIKGLSRPDS